ncbi:MAG: 1-aminocyclopropane-1-carboxylate deaminase/D-cysteine desulfhydrase [Fimbriimonadaceae bacterium]|nr:1-aminocyclopropane-1-carboxylate deaminase/D-cysteine desulfhydrase [Chitinophagales bacterium]
MQPVISQIKYNDHDIDILRLDLMHEGFQGNKYYKLKYNIEEAKDLGCSTILTFGGAFSNHIYATALAGKLHGLKTIGIIRGENDMHNPTINFWRENEMVLRFISREEYKRKDEPAFLNKLRDTFGKYYLIPEGGTNKAAIRGCTEILSGLENKYDFIFCAVGTGGTLAGIISTPNIKSKIIGVSVLKGMDLLTEKVTTLISNNNSNWEINFNYHLGGYAKYDQKLMEFIDQFKSNYSILPDPVYTGKVFYAIFDLIDKNYFSPGKKILAIHSGGLQGWDGWNYRFTNK